MALDLSTLSAQQQVAAIYIGYYDRAADPVGSDFWEAAVANPNLSLADIATDFSTQPETLIAYPFLGDPTAEQANAFIAELYLNLFNRSDVDAEGLQFWSDILLGSIAGTNDMSVGEIILSIIEGAQDTEAGNDRTTILNKIEVSTAWTDAAEAAGFTEDDSYADSPSLQNSAKSIIEGVTDDGATVTGAKSTIDNFFEDSQPSNPGEEFLLTSDTDVLTGTDADDEFNAYIQQNPFAGGVSNSLSSADRVDGGEGQDRLYAEITGEFVGVSGGYFGGDIDIQPRLKNIEEIDFEARDSGFNGGYYGGEDRDLPDVTVDAKNITDHEEIGSYFSDGDLRIENLTTLTNGGAARNTSEITVTMDHTDNFNSDGDASDLTVLFDNDYLLSGQESEGKVFYFLLDEDAELVDNPNRLNNIDVDGIRFNITNADGTVTDVTIEAIEANVAGTHQGFVNALQAPLQALIADGTLPAGTTLTLDPTVIDFTFLDDGSRSDEIPAIVLTSGDGSNVEATGFSRIEEEIGEYDVYGRFRSSNETEDQPISVDLDLHKAGRGGEGGDVIIGGKSADGSDDTTADGIADGIEVINVNVKGAGNDDPNGGMTKPSNVGTITSTGNELRQVFIATDPMFAAGDTFASLTVRNGFDEDTSDNEESGDLELINADAFLGDLTLGDLNANRDAGRITNADTITAQGGGDVTLGLLYDGDEAGVGGAQAYSVTTGGGNDDIDIVLDGDALDYAGSSLNVSTGGGDDNIDVEFDLNTDSGEDGGSSEQLNQAILDNVEIDGGAGDDVINVDGLGNANIDGGSGDDVIYTDGSGNTAVWAFNFDAVRVSDGSDDDVGDFDPDELPGEQTSLAYLGGATVTVTLSGAGIDVDPAAGGGVMSDGALGAINGDDGYEASVTIESLINGNDFYGDQRDINAAVMEAINDDPVLSNLLSVSMGANNTLVVSSLTSGDFDETDLRIDIAQRDFGPAAADWDGVESEAQSVFSNSNITVTSVASANTPSGEDLTTSASADAWYDGLSVAGDANSTADGVGEGVSNLHTVGTASTSETDNVIDGGLGNDLIVLSTDAVSVAGDVINFTNSSNNALINGASNETIVLTGDAFGDDTIMNFQDGDYTSGDFSDDTTPVAGEAEVFTVTFVAGPTAVTTADTLIFDGITINPPVDNGAADANAIATVVAAEYNLAGTNYTAVNNGDGSVTFTAAADGDQTDVTAADFTGTLAGTVQGVVVDTQGVDEVTATADVAPLNPGIDFLDFGAYLTSEDRIAPSSSSDSENLIEVTLDYGTDADAGEVGANEVVVVTYTDDTTNPGTFDSLSASDIAALFNNDANYDGTAFVQGNFDVVDNQGDNAVVNGFGKGILMVENAANDGEYKVFELTWDASAADGEENVSVNDLGSLDFGDSLTDLDEVNLVGSQSYEDLLDNGFFA